MQENSKKSAKKQKAARTKPALTVGLDLGDRFSRYCVVNGEGEVIEEGRIQTTTAALERHFAGEQRQRIAMEGGTHSPWVSRWLQGLGHEVLVANARKIRAITSSESKNDRNDAEKLARFAAYDVELLSPIQHRSPERQRDLNLLQARDTLVRARTMLVNAARGLVKSAGQRLPKCSPRAGHNLLAVLDGSHRSGTLRKSAACDLPSASRRLIACVLVQRLVRITRV